MNTDNINITKKLYYILSFISLIYQLLIYVTVSDLFVILIIFFSNIVTAAYCFNNKNFFKYPISSLLIFVSHFINLGGALYLKSIEFSLVTENLENPSYTVTNLTIFNLLIILSHYLYTKNIFLNNIKNTINNFYIKNEFFDIKDINLLYLVSFISLVGRLFFYTDLNAVSIEDHSFIFGPGIVRDLINGLTHIYLLPIVILFSDGLFNVNVHKKNYLFFAFFIICLIFIAFTKNSRSTLLDAALLALILLFIRFLFSKTAIVKKKFLSFFIILIISFYSINVIERVSLNFVQAKHVKEERSPIDNFKLLLKNIISNKDFSKYEKEKYESENLSFFAENYYKKTIFNRINVLLVHDNFGYLKKTLSKIQVANLKELEVNKILSIIPQPFINFFTDKFNKRDYQSFSSASFLYGLIEFGATSFSIGSALFSIFILFGNWTYLIFVFLFIPFFVIFDSFYDHKRQYFSPYILVFLYTTAFGILNFIAMSDLYNWFSLIFRVIPQTLIFVFLIKFIFDRLFTTR